jgi:glycosyltransferase involved in cell wall biosynthesis
MDKKLSIITINWNNAAGLQKTIESVVSQLDDHCEYIVVDGQSKDSSVDIINTFKDKITTYISEANEGIYGNMNKGIARAKGEYCLFLNSGDWLNSNILGQVLEACTGEDVIYFNTYLSYNGSRFEELKYPLKLTMRSFFKRTICHQSTLIKRDLFTRNGPYNVNFRLYSDYEFWIKSIIIGNATCRYVDKYLCYYDMGGQSSTPNESDLREVNLIQNQYLPPRVLDDYEYWYTKEREMETLLWYKNQKTLYGGLVFIYKVVKNINRLISKISE